MNKAILAILLVALVGAASAEETVINFPKINIDFETCFTAAARFAHEINAATEQIKTTPISINATLSAVYAAAETFNPLLHACNVDIALIDRVDAFTFNSTSTCFNNVEGVITSAKKIQELIQEKEIIENLVEIGKGIQEVLKSINEAKVHCQIVAKPTTTALLADGFDFNMNLLKCIAEAKNDVETAKTLIAELTAQSLPIEDAFEKTANLYNKVVVTVKDCGVEKIALPTIDNVAELKVCVKDVKDITNLVVRAYTDVKEKNFNDIFTTLKEIYGEFQQVQNSCIKKPKFLDF